MNISELLVAHSDHHDGFKAALAYFQRVMSVLLLVLGLVYWAIIVGVIPAGTGPFIDMPVPDKIATIHFAVVDLIAAVGMWMQVAWGNVIWVYAALAAVVLHGFFASRFGGNFLLILFSVVAMGIYIFLQVQLRRSAT